MTARRTIQREGWLITTTDGEKLTIARSEHSDELELPLTLVPLLMADLREITSAANPRNGVAEWVAELQAGKSER